MSLPSDGGRPDLRDTLNKKQRQHVSPESGRGRYVTVSCANNVQYDHLLRQHSRDQQKRTSADSDRARRQRADGRTLQSSSDSSCERSSQNNCRGSERRDRSRSTRSSPFRTKKAREESMERRDILRRGKHIQQKLANMPSQKIYRLDRRCNGATYPGLPIRSLTEKCTAAEQHRRWINDSPTRSTETLSDYNRWITHFKTAEQHPIHLTTLSPEGQAKTKWWHTFLVEVKAINGQHSIWR